MGKTLLYTYIIMMHHLLCTVGEMLSYDNHYYEFSSNTLKWEDAKSQCVTNGGYLVSVDSIGENSFLVSNAAIKHYWIGLKYSGGSWRWTSGSQSTFHDWDYRNGNPTSQSSKPYAFIHDTTKMWRNQDTSKSFNYICEYEDQCAPNNPCQNSGVCTSVEMWRNYTCDCSGTGFRGRNCEELNYCGENTICYHGSCQSNEENGCSCDSGYMGIGCNSYINECDAGTHGCQQGSCENLEGAYRCNCDPDYTGNHCETQINDCAISPCFNNGTCIDGINQYTCDCDSRFQAQNCQDDFDECTIEPNICNTGQCHNNHGGYNCTCSGYSGTNCETDINECESSPAICENGATCVNKPGTYRCNCTGTGYEGYNCTTNIDECHSNPCQNSGTCVDHIARFECTCSDVFNGTLCEDDINECLNETICTVGVCVNIYGGFNCSCPPGFEGETCEDDIDECLNSSACHFHGNCTNTNGNFTCTCFYPYESITCANVSPYNFIFDDPNEQNGTKERLTKALIAGCVLTIIALIVIFCLLFENKIKAVLHRKAPSEQRKTIEENTAEKRV